MRPVLARGFILCCALWLAGCDWSDETGGDTSPDGGTLPDGGAPGNSGQTDFAREILSAHNQVRISASNPVPSPPLAALQWSASAASTAQAWADQCDFKHNPNRGNLGENIAAATPNQLTTAGVVQNWAAEAAYYDYGTNACAPGKVCGHYTQVSVRRSPTPPEGKGLPTWERTAGGHSITTEGSEQIQPVWCGKTPYLFAVPSRDEARGPLTWAGSSAHSSRAGSGRLACRTYTKEPRSNA